MKRLIIISTVLLAICGAVFIGYFAGYQRGYQRALILQAGTFVVSLDALDRLRGGDVPGGTRAVEAMCFSSADIVYGDPHFQHDWAAQFVGKSMIDDLRHYRQTYCTNSTEWTPTERTLEKILASRKS